MSPERGLEQGSDTSPRMFVTTHWSVVLAAGQETSAQADGALQRFCRVYWWPLYAFVRGRGYLRCSRT